jgi:hypothetical protein
MNNTGRILNTALFSRQKWPALPPSIMIIIDHSHGMYHLILSMTVRDCISVFNGFTSRLKMNRTVDKMSMMLINKRKRSNFQVIDHPSNPIYYHGLCTSPYLSNDNLLWSWLFVSRFSNASLYSTNDRRDAIQGMDVWGLHVQDHGIFTRWVG